ncbi:MAG: DUF99 family protein, partial [Candidatus Competibacteraceae bacterium]|nr:DUF99 family protein [Candidatus Competibacteraceae bacterium]
RLANLIGFDDAPFPRSHRGDVTVIGAVFAAQRLEGVLRGRVRRDGANATRVLTEMVEASRFDGHIQAVLLQGIALAGFNVVDIHVLHQRLARPVLVVARRQPDIAAIRRALLERVSGGRRKWALIQAAGPMEPVGEVWVQRAGLSLAQAGELIGRSALHSHIPEPLRCAHLIAGGITRAAGGSGQRV